MSVAVALSSAVTERAGRSRVAVGTEPFSTTDEISDCVSFSMLITSLVSICLKFMTTALVEGSTSDLLAAIRSDAP